VTSKIRIRRTWLAIMLSLALVGAGLSVPLTAAAASGRPPARTNSLPVSGAAAPKLSVPELPASSISEHPEPATLPGPASYSGTLSSANDNHRSSATDVQQWIELGTTGISFGAAKADSSRDATASVQSISAKVLDGKSAKSSGLSGLVLDLKRTDGETNGGAVALRIPDSSVRQLYGADYASRIRWLQFTENAKGKLSRGTKVFASYDGTSKSTILTPTVSGERTLVAATSSGGSSSGTGNYAASPLATSGLWDVSSQTGDFTWSYPMRTPPAAAGPAPELSLDYDAQSVDGKTGSTNNQTSAVGEGWSLSGGGFIERSFVACSHDDGTSGPVLASGDECWKNDNATVSFAGHAGVLVHDAASGAWKLQSDDGSRVEHLVGTAAGCAPNGTYDNDCWRITTTDGMQYYFGLNQLPGWTAGSPTTNSAWTVPVFGNDPGEPCHSSNFASSSCTQAWRWNLDYVVDSYGNAQALYYNAETNKYAQNGGAAVSYVRGGQLDHIDYGFKDGTAFASNAASDRVTFKYASTGRCSDRSGASCSTAAPSGSAAAPANPSSYPDVPFDQLCASACPTLISPTFWTNGMLEKVSTSVLKAGTYVGVDSWTLDHSFPSPGDGTSPALWLSQIVHTGTAGTSPISEPATVFAGIAMQNRVWPLDGLAPLDKYRLSSITNSTGGVVSVNYSAQECTASNAAAIKANLSSNTMRCFPQWWAADITPPQPVQLDLFHKYVVTAVNSDPRTGGGLDHPLETQYIYTGSPAWRYDNSPLTQADHRTWSMFAGYDSVEVRNGSSQNPAAQEVTDYSFFRGLDGDRADTSGGTKSVFVAGSTTVKDSLWFAGTVRSEVTHNGVGGPTLSTTLTTPWASSPTANDGTSAARLLGISETSTTESISTGGTRSVTVSTVNDAVTGLPLAENTAATGQPSSCTTTSYTPPNTTAWIIGLPSRVATVATDCSSAAAADPSKIGIEDTKLSYDGLPWGVAPTRGDVTQTQKVDKYDGATAHWLTATQTTFDSMGRPLQATDSLGHVSKTDYVPSASAPSGSGALTSITATAPSPFNWTTTTAFDPSWGAEVAKTDPNGKITTTTFDSLGRKTAVWNQDHAQSTFPNQPSLQYGYGVSNTASNWTSTSTLAANIVTTTFELTDGLGRSIQQQRLAEGGGTVISDQMYDAAGRPNIVNSDYWAPSVEPSGTLFIPTAESEVPSETLTDYDGAGRPLSSVLYSLGAERFRTTTSYPGADRVDSTPPAGGTPTSQLTDAFGRQVKLVQYLAPTISSNAPSKTTSYTYDSSGNLSTMSDPVGNVWNWTYDLSGRLLASSDPDRGTTTNSYDAGGNLIATTDANGNTLAYTYDSIGRQTAEFKDSTGGPLLASWKFDSLAKGQPTSATRYIGSTADTPGLAYISSVNGYDAGYRPTSSTISIPTGAPAFGGTSYTTSFGYYASGALASVLYPAVGGLPSERLRYSYDSTGKTSGLFGSNPYASVAYTAIGQPSEHQRNGDTSLFTDYGYDPATGALTSSKSTTQSGSTFTDLRAAKYSYDDAGNVTSISTTAPGSPTDTQCFKFDELQNLKNAWTPTNGNCATGPSTSNLGGPAPYWNDYTVSPDTGNRTAVTRHIANSSTTATDNYVYPLAGSAGPHQVQSVATTGNSPTITSFSYDANGSTNARADQTMKYDAEGKLSSVTSSAGTQTNIYDASGAILVQTDPTQGSTLFLGDTRLRKLVGSSQTTAERTYSIDGAAVAERRTSAGSSDSSLVWLGTDAQGTVTDQVNATTGQSSVVRLDPFGNARPGSSSAWPDNRGFLNATTNSTTGLTQVGVRTYDSSLGRFLTVDPILSPGTPQQNNGYSYAANNPVTYSDPSGACFSSAKKSCKSASKGASKKASASKAPKAAKKAAKKQEQWWNPTTWSSKTWRNVGAVAAGVAVSVGIVAAVVGAGACTAVTFGVCGAVIIGVAAVAGAAGAAVTYNLQSGSKSAQGMAQAVGFGALGGALGAAAGPIIGKVVGAVASKISGGAATGASRAAASVSSGTAASDATSGAAPTVTQAAKGSAPTSAFWSGGPVARRAAEKWATSNNAVTLEMTARGQQVEQATAGMEWRDAAPIWDTVSEAYAQGTSGTAHVFQNAEGVKLGSVWARIEYPTLIQNGNPIIYHVVGGP